MSIKKAGYFSELIVIDNSKFPYAEDIVHRYGFQYFYNNGFNPGFGKAHNLSRHLISTKEFHTFINPDIIIDSSSDLDLLFSYIISNISCVLVQPLIRCVESDQIQYLCKQNPTFVAMAIRKFPYLFIPSFRSRYDDWYTMKSTAYGHKPVQSEYLSGSFMICRRSVLDLVGWFDEQYFLYLEDADLTRGMAAYGACIHYSLLLHILNEKIIQIFACFANIISFIRYSFKWGLNLDKICHYF